MNTRSTLAAAALTVALATTTLGATPAGASPRDAGDAGDLGVHVVLAGADLDDTHGAVGLDPDDEVVLELVVDNRTGEDLEVQKVRLAGSVLGMGFFTFTTRIDMAVDDGERGDRRIALDLTDLDGQASGLLAGEVQLLGDGNEVLATQSFTADAHGAATSTFSLFGLVVGLLTGVLLLSVVQGLRKGTLPTNRFNRAIRFAEPGAGLGLAMTFTLSALRIVLVPAPLGLLFVAVGAGVGFAVGYTLSHAGAEVLDLRDQPVAAPAADGPRIPVWN